MKSFMASAWGMFCVSLLVPGPARAGQFELLSPAATESETADGWSMDNPESAISADGRWIVFTSGAMNLVADDQNSYAPDLFLRDRLTGTTAVLSGSAFSGVPSISADGRWIVFENPLTEQIYLHDRDTGVTALVSRSAADAAQAGNDQSYGASVSADGEWVVFVSEATNLVSGMTKSSPGGEPDVFLFERATGEVTLVSRAAGSATVTGNQGSAAPSLSADGRRIAFESAATNLVAGASTDIFNVYLFDRETGTTTLVSHTSASVSTGAGGVGAVISPEGDAVAFYSDGTALMAGQSDTASTDDVFLYDRASGTNVLVSHTAASPTIAGGVWSHATPLRVATGGAYVAFASRATNLVAGQSDTNDASDLFLFERATSSLTLVSRSGASAVQAANDATSAFRLAEDGSRIVFQTRATDVVAGQSDAHQIDDDYDARLDVFLFDRAAGTNSLLSGSGGSGQIAGNGTSQLSAMSADGAWITFFTAASNLVPGSHDYNQGDDLILHDGSASEIVSVHAPGLGSNTAGGASAVISVSADGRYAVLLSGAENIVPGQIEGNRGADVFLVDRTAGTTILVSRSAASADTTGNAGSFTASISTDGGYVVFVSAATDLVPGQVDSNLGRDIFLFDRASGSVALVSHAAGSAATTGNRTGDEFDRPVISGDGRYVAFAHRATDLVAGMAVANSPEEPDIFLYDRVSGHVILVSHAAGSAATTGNGASELPGLSADGRYLAYQSTASDLVPGAADANDSPDTLLYDRVTGQTLLVSRASGTAATAGNGGSLGHRLSTDGRYLAFSSTGANLVPGQEDSQFAQSGDGDVFLFDRVTGTVELISRFNGSATRAANAYSVESRVSDDGRYVLFLSASMDLVPGLTDDTSLLEAFVHDRVLRTTELISRSMSSPNKTQGCLSADLSPDGRYVAFAAEGHYVFDRQTRVLEMVTKDVDLPILLSADGSTAFVSAYETKLVAGDRNGTLDAFAYVRSAPQGSDFFTVSPCRVETGTTVASDSTLLLELHGACGVPDTATAVAVNVTVVQPTGTGRLTLHPGNLAAPLTSTLNFAAGRTLANNAILPLALNGEGSLAVTPFVNGNGTVRVILDVNGYFE